MKPRETSHLDVMKEHGKTRFSYCDQLHASAEIPREKHILVPFGYGNGLQAIVNVTTGKIELCRETSVNIRTVNSDDHID